MKRIGGMLISLALVLGISTVKAEEVKDIKTSADLATCMSASNTCVLSSNIDLSDNIYILKEQKVILDLNGYTVNYNGGAIQVGDYTEVNGVVTETFDGGILTINDSTGNGSIDNTNGYGIVVFYGGKVIINGGQIHSKDSALSGNNVHGDMNVEMNGGTLTADEGPAIYMPSQVNLIINGGTLNGGLGLRMGQVTINGGTINNNSAKNTDSIETYYTNNGNVWYQGAIFVSAGTYDESNSTNGYGNTLNLTINGGTFTSTLGDALVVYKMRRTNQEVNITINGGSFTAADGYKALKIWDITTESFVTNSAYKNASKIVDVNTIITGGTYSTSVESLIDNTKYKETETNGNYVVSLNTVVESTTDDGKEASVTTDEGLLNNYRLVVETVTLEEEEEESVNAVLGTKISSLLGTSKKATVSPKLVKVYDIAIKDENDVVVDVEKGTYSVTIAVDEDTVKNYNSIKVAYLDEDGNVAEILDATYEDGKVTFVTSHFSKYGIIGYTTEDVASNTTTNPATNDSIGAMVGISLMSVSLLIASGYQVSKKMK